MSEFVKDTLTLRGKEIPVTVGLLLVRNLKFYPENPRIYSIVNVNEEVISQEEIQERLASMDHVKQLVQSIKANGGLTDPIIVRQEVVLEGNSRLAAYRLLAAKDPVKWGRIKCKVLPEDIGDDAVFALLGEYHIIGKKDWAPFEQAGYLYRRHKNHGISVKRIAEEVGLGQKEIAHKIKVYAFMIEHNENDINRWSYYDEYFKARTVKRAREAHPELDGVIIDKIRSGEINRAADIRDKLKVIAAAKPKTLAQMINGQKTFDECYQSASDQGVNEACLRKLHSFRIWLVESETEENIGELKKELKEKCLFELKKISQRATHLVQKCQDS